jgi:hypothetical protein
MAGNVTAKDKLQAALMYRQMFKASPIAAMRKDGDNEFVSQ